MLRLSRLTAGSSVDDTGAEQQLRASPPQSIPRMPVHGHAGAHADAHARVVTFDSFLTSAARRRVAGLGPLRLSVTQMLNDVCRECIIRRSSRWLLTENRSFRSLVLNWWSLSSYFFFLVMKPQTYSTALKFNLQECIPFSIISSR